MYELYVMPFVLTNAPAAFQLSLQQVLMGLNPKDGELFVSVYTDDILAFSKNLDQHLDDLNFVLDSLIDVNLKLRPKKSRFLRKEVDFLRFVITPNGLKTSEQHVKAVQCRWMQQE